MDENEVEYEAGGSFMGTLNSLSEEDQETLLNEIASDLIEKNNEYIEALDEDDALRLYYEFHAADDDEPVEDEDIPRLFATVPLDTKIEKILTGSVIPVLSTVQITFLSGLGDVGITENLEPTDKHQARVNYETLINYRSEP